MEKRLLLLGLLVLTTLFTTPAFAGSYYTLETDNFLIHYPVHLSGDYPARTGQAAEAAHQILTPQFRYQPNSKTHLVILDDTDLANGFADTLLYNRMGIYPAAVLGYGYRSGLSPDGLDWLDRLVLHEYAHILHLDLNTGTARNLRTLFGRIPGVTTPHLFQPYALVEGIAVWHESNNTRGGRGSSTFYRMFLEAILDSDTFLAPDQALGMYSLTGWQPGTPFYFYGYWFVDYLISEYGERDFYRFLDLLADKPTSIESGLIAVYHRGLTQLWDDMENKLRANHLTRTEGTVTSQEHLPTEGDLQRNPVVSPDGRYLAYFASGQVMGGIRVYDLRNGKDQAVISGSFGDEADLAWMDDNRLIYGKLSYNLSGELRYDLYSYDLASLTETRLTFGERAYGGKLLSDGSIAYLRRTTGGTQMVVGGQGTLSDLGDNLLIASIAVSSNDELVADITVDGYRNLYFLDQETQSLTALTHDRSTQGNPTFTPDNRYILFDSDYHGRFNIFAYDREANRFYQVTDSRYGAFSPEVSASGEKIFFMDYTPQGYKLAETPLEVSSWREVTVAKEELVVDEPVTTTGDSKPYSPWTSLKPSFWLPLVNSEPQLWTGLFLAGKDALEQHSYSLAVGYGFEAESLDYQLSYGYRFMAPYDPTIQADFTRDSELTEEGQWRSGSTLEMELTISDNSVYDGWQLGTGMRATKSENEWVITARTNAAHFSNSGRDYWRSTRLISLAAEREVNTQEKYYQLQLGWNENWRVVAGPKLSLETRLSVSDDPSGIQVGGFDGPFAVRGFGKQQMVNPQKISVQLEQPLFRIERGLLHYPIFLEELTIAAFWDQIDSFQTDRWQSLGLEIGVNMSLGYGTASLAPRVGVAFPQGALEPNWYARMEVGSFQF